MGVDIHMYLIHKDGTYLHDNLYDGRCGEWFSNLQGRGWDNEYEHLMTNAGIPDFVDGKIREDASHEPGYGYYGFHYMTVTDYVDWFNKYRPDLDAGWVSTYDKWAMEKKGVEPELKRYLDPKDNVNDMHFVEFADKWDPNVRVLEVINECLAKTGVSAADCYIVFYFDC